MAAFAALLATGPVQAQPASAQGGTQRALLIGINGYRAVPQLRGALNDVALMREVLITRFGFPADQVETLTEEAATRAGMLGALDALAERAGPDDLVYVHYSGHGSQAADYNGDEADRRDETLIPQDGRTEGVPDITDDELAAALGRIRARALIVVLDSCHSGTATRGAVLQPRAVPPDTRTELYAGRSTRAVVPLVKANHVLLTGAADDQEALDGPIEGRPHGLFSYALARSLANAPPTASAREVLAGANLQLQRVQAQLGLVRMPEPQLEATAGRLDQALLARPVPAPAAGSGGSAADASAAEAPARLPWLAVRPGPAGQALLVGGRRLGAVPGSLWAIYGPGERAFAPGSALAEAEVQALVGDDARLSLRPADFRPPAGARATALAPALAPDSLPVRLAASDAARAARLREALARHMPALRFVEPGDFARFVVDVDGPAATVRAADGRTVVARFELADEAALVTALSATFARSMTAAELLSLDNPASELTLEFAVAGTGEAVAMAGAEGGERVADAPPPAFRVRRPGEPRSRANSLQLRVRASRACYLTLVDVDAAGAVTVLFPNPISEERGYLPDGALAAGEEVRVPDSLEAGNRAGFYADYAPPAGVDTLRAFCATELTGARALREALTPLARPDASRERVRAALGGVRGTLSSAMARGVRIVADGADEESASEPAAPAGPPAFDWAAASVTVEVRE